MAEYLAMLEDAVLTAEQVIAGRRQAPGKGSFDPKTIFAAADAVRAKRRPAAWSEEEAAQAEAAAWAEEAEARAGLRVDPRQFRPRPRADRRR